MPVEEYDDSGSLPTRKTIAFRFVTLAVPLLIAFGQQQLAYTLVDVECRNGAILLAHLPPILALILVALLGRAAWREAGGVRDGAPIEPEGLPSVPQFFGVVGVTLSALAAVLIVAQWLPTLSMHPCQH